MLHRTHGFQYDSLRHLSPPLSQTICCVSSPPAFSPFFPRALLLPRPESIPMRPRALPCPAAFVGVTSSGATPAGRAFASNWHGTVVRRSCPVTGRSNCSKLCNGWCAPDGSCAGDCNENRCCTTDQQVLNRMVKTPPPSGRCTSTRAPARAKN